MAVEFKLPELGENIEEAEVAEVLVKEGDTIEAEQTVMELETEKAVVELPAPRAGRVEKVHVSAGDTIKVGDLVLTIAEEDGQAATDKERPAEPTETAEADEVQQRPPESRPKKTRSRAKPPEKKPKERREDERAAEAKKEHPEAGDEEPPPPAGPATRHLARKLGVDLHRVRGTGPGGRITQDDVEAFVRNLTSGGTQPAGTAPALPDFEQFGPVEQQRLSKLNRTAVEQLATSWQVIPHVTQHELADVTELEAARKRYLQTAGKDGPKITMAGIAVKACSQLLREFPKFNSSLDVGQGVLVLKRYCHIGVAVDTEYGLLVPVIRDADQKSLRDISAELIDLAELARNRKLELSQMQGATFTITNLGGIGGTAFTPIVNWPEVAILGISRSRPQVQMVDGRPQERLMMPLSLSYDHRVVNGADAARFVVRLAAILRDPFAMLVDC